MSEQARGPGRPPSGRVQVSIRMRPDVIERLDAAREGSRSEAIEEAVEAWLRSRRPRSIPMGRTGGET